MDAQDYILGYFQPSLRDCSWRSCLPRTASWATLSRPFGTEFVTEALTQPLKAIIRERSYEQNPPRVEGIGVRLYSGKSWILQHL
jgi:hypothetical protein